MDLALEGATFAEGGLALTGFQSLFLWILLSKSAEGHGHRLILLSFNPCFYGSCSRRMKIAQGWKYGPVFQSLFLWILLSKRTMTYYSSSPVGVSILVFMDLALEA